MKGKLLVVYVPANITHFVAQFSIVPAETIVERSKVKQAELVAQSLLCIVIIDEVCFV